MANVLVRHLERQSMSNHAEATEQAEYGSQPCGLPAQESQTGSRIDVFFQQEDRRMTAGSTALLEGLHPEAAVRSDAPSGGCIVGLDLRHAGPSSLFDVCIGRVGRAAAARIRMRAVCKPPQPGAIPARPRTPRPTHPQLRCRRFMALSRAKLYWMVPSWGSAAGELPVETQLLLLELEVGWGGCPLGFYQTDCRLATSPLMHPSPCLACRATSDSACWRLSSTATRSDARCAPRAFGWNPPTACCCARRAATSL